VGNQTLTSAKEINQIDKIVKDAISSDSAFSQLKLAIDGYPLQSASEGLLIKVNQHFLEFYTRGSWPTSTRG